MEQIKELNKWTRKEFEALPLRKWNEEIGEIDSLVILPTRRIHDSGFRCMDFVAVIKGVPTVRLSGCSDVIHFDGIGGLGYDWASKGGVPTLVTPTEWQIDCLKISGLLRIFAEGITVGAALSSFEIYSLKDRYKK